MRLFWVAWPVLGSLACGEDLQADECLAPTGLLNLESNLVDFGETPLGTERLRFLKFSNGAACIQPLSIVEGVPFSQDFSFVSVPSELDSGEVDEIVFRFGPTTDGLMNAIAVVVVGFPPAEVVEEQSIELRGTGILR